MRQLANGKVHLLQLQYRSARSGGVLPLRVGGLLFNASPTLTVRGPQ